MELSVVYPAYNESENARDTVVRTIAALREIADRFEVLIIDDGSRDGTPEIVESLALQYPEVRLLRNPVNVGQGATLLRGFAEARLEWVLHNAMDYPFDLRDLAKMKPLLNEADVVVATRDARAGYSLYRVVLSMANRLLLQVLFGMPIRDLNFVQLYRKKVLENISVQSRSTAFLTPELVLRARDQGYRIREVQIQYHPRFHGEATSGKLKVILTSLRDMLRFWAAQRKWLPR